MEGHKPVYKVRNQLIHPLKRDLIRVHRQSVEGWPIQAGKTLQSIQSSLLIEHLRVALESMGRIEDAGTSAGGLLGSTAMGSGVRAQKKARIPTRRCFSQGQTMLFALRDGQTVKVTAKPACKH